MIQSQNNQKSHSLSVLLVATLGKMFCDNMPVNTKINLSDKMLSDKIIIIRCNFLVIAQHHCSFQTFFINIVVCLHISIKKDIIYKMCECPLQICTQQVLQDFFWWVSINTCAYKIQNMRAFKMLFMFCCKICNLRNYKRILQTVMLGRPLVIGFHQKLLYFFKMISVFQDTGKICKKQLQILSTET